MLMTEPQPQLQAYKLETVMVMILTTAVRDAQGVAISDLPPKDKYKVIYDARQWLVSEDAFQYCAVLGYDHKKLVAWVENGCTRICKLQRLAHKQNWEIQGV